MPSFESLLTENLLYDHLGTNAFAFDRPDRAGCPDGQVGIEVEFFPLIRSRIGTPLAQPAREGTNFFMGLYPWLRQLAERHGWKPESTEAAALAFLLPNGGWITLEPGGQVEYSSPPFPSVECALEDVENVERVLCSEGESAGLFFAAEGYNRWLGPATVPQLIVPKPRYQVMDRHFERIGPYGRQMMRQTCATQINLDFGAPATALRRWLLANRIVPALNALFANSPHLLNGRFHRSYRYEIWRRTDPTRAGRAVGAEEGDPVAAYLQFALDAHIMLVPSQEEEVFLWPLPAISFRGWMNGEGDPRHGFPDLEDWERHLTTLFPHVRPRGFMEIRSIDALPADLRRAAVILTTELLYNERLLDAALTLTSGIASAQSAKEKTGNESDWEERLALGKKLLAMAVEETGNAVLRKTGSLKLEV